MGKFTLERRIIHSLDCSSSNMEILGLLSITATGIVILGFILLIALWIRARKLKPSNDRSWVNDNSKNARIEFDGDLAKITNIRDLGGGTNLKLKSKWREETLTGDLLGPRVIGQANLFIENLLINKFKSGTILLGSTNPLRLYEITKMISNYFKVKNYIKWRIDKKRGFYLNINNALGNYNFSSINTQKGILEYLKKNYRK